MLAIYRFGVSAAAIVALATIILWAWSHISFKTLHIPIGANGESVALGQRNGRLLVMVCRLIPPQGKESSRVTSQIIQGILPRRADSRQYWSERFNWSGFASPGPPPIAAC